MDGRQRQGVCDLACLLNSRSQPAYNIRCYETNKRTRQLHKLDSLKRLAVDTLWHIFNSGGVFSGSPSTAAPAGDAAAAVLLRKSIWHSVIFGQRDKQEMCCALDGGAR